MQDLRADADGVLTGLPIFELGFVFDDDVEPSRVTVYAEFDDGFTDRWITMDVDSAVPLDQVA